MPEISDLSSSRSGHVAKVDHNRLHVTDTGVGHILIAQLFIQTVVLFLLVTR